MIIRCCSTKSILGDINIIDSTDINNDKILVVYIPDIHESLAGIVAGRVKEKYNKPTKTPQNQPLSHFY